MTNKYPASIFAAISAASTLLINKELLERFGIPSSVSELISGLALAEVVLFALLAIIVVFPDKKES